MEAAFTENAYQILGLPVSAEQSEIKKRARLLIAQIAIGENKLPTDLSICGLDRTEDLVKNAVQRLSTPQGKTREVYFWFSDEGVDYLPKSGTVSDIEKAVQHLSMRSAQKGKWNAKRDHAVFLMRLLFFKKSKKKYLLESLGLWKDLIHADSAWKYFGLYFKNIDDVQLGDSVMVNLRQWVDTTVSDLYSELSEKWNDAEYALAYTKVFGKISRHAHKNILTPRANEIEKATQDLGSIVWHDGALSKKNVDEVKKCVAIIQNALNKLMDSDLYEEPDVIAIRDKASDAIRSVAIDLTNQYDDFERSALLLSIAEEISGTHSTKTRTQSEKKTVEDNRATQKFLVPVLDLINKGKFLKAVEYIEHQMAVNEDDPRALKILKSQLTPVMGRYITETRSSAMEKLEKKDFQGATQALKDLAEAQRARNRWLAIVAALLVLVAVEIAVRGG